jgi:outer membrane lipoprotein-sorting protein
MKQVILLANVLLLTVSSLYAQDARFELKSAILKKETIAAGQKIENTLYIDEYGKKESNEVIQKLGGVANIEQRILTILDGNSYITVNAGLKTATRIQISDTQVNYLKLTPEIREKYKIKEVGQETVAGKPCRKLILEMTQMGQTVQATVWIWKGLPLKSEMSTNGMIVITEKVTEIQENISVPADKFKVPEGITIQ